MKTTKNLSHNTFSETRIEPRTSEYEEGMLTSVPRSLAYKTFIFAPVCMIVKYGPLWSDISGSHGFEKMTVFWDVTLCSLVEI
jgi:hypothetical protein